MDKKTAWENFKNTGDINMYLEMKEIQRQENMNIYNLDGKENMGDKWQIQK